MKLANKFELEEEDDEEKEKEILDQIDLDYLKLDHNTSSKIL